MASTTAATAAIGQKRRRAAQKSAAQMNELTPPELFYATMNAEVRNVRLSPNGTAFVSLAVPRDTDAAREISKLKGMIVVAFGHPPLSAWEAAHKRTKPAPTTDDDLRDLTVQKLTDMLESENTELQLRAATVVQNMRAQITATEGMDELRGRMDNLLNEVRGGSPGAVVAGTDHPDQAGPDRAPEP